MAQPRRTWFRFSLRSLFVVITCACVWLGYQMNIVHQRQALRKSIVARGGVVTETDPSAARMPDLEGIAWYRQLLGDRAAASIELPPDPATHDVSIGDLQAALEIFPEAEVSGSHLLVMRFFRQRDLTGKLETVELPTTVSQ